MPENLYKQIADEYLREYGAQLRRELDSLEQGSPGGVTPALDSRVRRGIAAHKRARFIKYTGLVAACLIIMLAAPFLLRLAPDYSLVSEPGARTNAPTVAYETLPLSFTLPAQFTIASVEQDLEKTVYHLKDSQLNDVILTLERSGDIARYNNLTALSIGGHSAFGSDSGGYSLLAFADKDSRILYVLTCKYDINTLILLGERILIMKRDMLKD